MAGGRNYNDIVSVGNVSIYAVSADPNGTLSAAAGSLAIRDDAGVQGIYQNTDGLTTWVLLIAVNGLGAGMSTGKTVGLIGNQFI
jgi:hypothetical protein